MCVFSAVITASQNKHTPWRTCFSLSSWSGWEVLSLFGVIMKSNLICVKVSDRLLCYSLRKCCTCFSVSGSVTAESCFRSYRHSVLCIICTFLTCLLKLDDNIMLTLQTVYQSFHLKLVFMNDNTFLLFSSVSVYFFGSESVMLCWCLSQVSQNSFFLVLNFYHLFILFSIL